MKSVISILFLIFISHSFAQGSEFNLKFEKSSIEYGTVVRGSDMNRKIVFKNNGRNPVEILSVTPSGINLTITDFPKKPILPGQSAEISINFNRNYIGDFYKEVIIIYRDNFRNESESRIKVIGKVIDNE